MNTVQAHAAILFEPDGYVLSGPKLMGRQAAGNAFLRAAVAGRDGGPLYAYTPHRRSAEVFASLVHQQDPAAPAQWIPANRLDALSEVGTLYVPGPALGQYANMRLRQGCDAFSVVGVTHTTASHGAMDSIVDMLSAPVMPWDALICTSTAVAGTVKVLLEAEIEALRWRFGTGINLTLPQLPIIPLGVHCKDFEFSIEERAAARAALGIADDEVVALFVGRLSFHAKAHPYAMYAGLQEAAQRSGKKLTLVQSGWFANDAVRGSFVQGAAAFCPSVKALFTDGKDEQSRRQSWAAADIFISLSDNIQETFGLTPIEAMAAGLPVVVADWDGYRDTVRDGVDGYRVPTWMPPPNLGDVFALGHETGVDNYDFYCGLTCQTVAVDIQVLSDRISALAMDRSLRTSLGAAGKERARQEYDWSVVYRRYQDLYKHLGDIRKATASQPEWRARIVAAPKAAASRLDPYKTFGHYPTALLQPDSIVSAAAGFDEAGYKGLAAHGLFNYAAKVLPAPERVGSLLAFLGQAPLSIGALSIKANMQLGETIMALSVMGKMGLVQFSNPARDALGQA